MTGVYSVSDKELLSKITEQAKKVAEGLIIAAKLKKGELMVVGCSSSEVLGEKIGSNSSLDVAHAIFDGIYPVLKANGIYLATQCCEHLNRAIIIEKEAADKFGYDEVNVIPQPKAGGSFSTVAYESFENPCAVEHIRADAGIDIGLTMIGMHLKPIAVPVRLETKKIGEAAIVCARTRAKFVGGSRAVYNESLL